MTQLALYPNPLLQSLQLAGADWSWTDDSLLEFWKTTEDTMNLNGWARFSYPWAWTDIHAAYLARLGACIVPNPTIDAVGVNSFRMEACIALWLSESYELRWHRNAPNALSSMYLPRVDASCLDEEAALLWSAILSFELNNVHDPLSTIFKAWRRTSPNNMRWVHAYKIVNVFKMDLWPTARHMHRLVHNDGSCEEIHLDGLLV